MITTLLFDLDNTLYPAESPINKMITERMIQFVMKFLNVSREEALERRKLGLEKYGSTLFYLRSEENLTDIDEFMNFVHPSCEVNELIPDTNLRDYLISIPLKKAVLTNAPMIHANRVLDFFNIKDLFVGVYDIAFHNYKAKPYPEAYLKTLKAADFELETTLFLDDLPKYIEGFAKIGGQTLLIDQFDKYKDLPYNKVNSVYKLKEFLQK